MWIAGKGITLKNIVSYRVSVYYDPTLLWNKDNSDTDGYLTCVTFT